MIRFGVALLAGGEGSRIGGGKPLRRLAGVTLLERARHQALSWGGATVLVLRSRDQVPATDLKTIFDDPTIAGPLGGLAAALVWARGEGLDAVLTLPCDMPFLPVDLPECLAAALAPEIAVAMAGSGGRSHPICAMWRPIVLGRLQERAAHGQLSLRGLAEQCGSVEVQWSDAADPFFNINTEADLVRAGKQRKALSPST